VIELTDEQEAVAEAAMAFVRKGSTPDGRRWFSFESLAGCGKTVVLIELARRLPRANLIAVFGKAASNLTIKSGLAAATLHSSIYRLRDEDIDERGRRELFFDRAIGDGALRRRVFLLDEHGVCDEQTGADLMRTGALVIAAGDPGQLPPVKGKRFFERPEGPDARLTTVHRQAWDSGIIRQAWSIRESGRYASDGPEMQVVGNVTGEMIKEADMLLCWKNVTRRSLIGLKRAWLGLPEGRLTAGEPVMCLLNQHDLGIMNGQVVELADDYEAGGVMEVRVGGKTVVLDSVWVEGIDGDEMDWGRRGVVPFASGWASTVHKAIGSEYDRVVFSDEYTRPENRREFLYTGTTRAAKQCVVLR
jgi:exodeoxyribonuclease-5